MTSFTGLRIDYVRGNPYSKNLNFLSSRIFAVINKSIPTLNINSKICMESVFNHMGENTWGNIVSFIQSLSRVWLFATPWTAAHQAYLSTTNSQSPPKPMSIESVMHPAISSSVLPFSFCPQSFPASGSFQMSQLFASGSQSIGVPFNISPSNEHPRLISFRLD